MEHAPTVAVAIAVASADGNGGEQVNSIIVGERTREISRRDRRDWEASTASSSSVWAGWSMGDWCW